jgi:Glucosamine 6-phosphate synthetase, contains amidotransferase and phosphosugar isomerase domains
MCGIVGLYGKGTSQYPASKRNWMLEALVVDSIRGYDSTGLAWLPKNNTDEVRVYKKDVAGYDFVQLKPVLRMADSLTSCLGLMGHNRSATKGIVTSANAHPFIHKHITLVHNGTVSNAEWLITGKDKPKGITVDSDYVSHAFSLEEPNDILPRLAGSYSLVWFDSDTRTLHFARNDARPMFIIFDAQDEVMYYGSELRMLEFLAERNNIKIEESVYRTEPFIHYTFDSENIRKVHKRPFVHGQSSFQSHMKRRDVSTGHTQVIPVSAVTTPWEPTKNGKDLSTPASSANTTTKEVPKSSLPDRSGIGSKEAREASSFAKEIIKAHQATGELIDAKGKKLKKMNNLIHDWGLKPSCILAKGVFFKHYETETNEPVATAGWMLAKPLYSTQLGLFQVFHVQYERWQNELRYKTLYLEPITVRNIDNEFKEEVLVCRIREDLMQKHSKRLHDQEQKHGLMDLEGDQSDWVEIGTSRKKKIHPYEYSRILRDGCTYCSDPLDSDGSNIEMWIGTNDDKPLCTHCAHDTKTLEALANIH